MSAPRPSGDTRPPEARLLARLRRLTNALRGDAMERFRLLRRTARWLLPHYRLTWPDLSWWRIPAFTAYLERFGEADGLNTHRRWNLGQLMRLVDGVPGDTAECGVLEGAGSFLMARINAGSSQQRRHHVFDSFEGLSAPGRDDGEHWSAGDLSVPVERVSRNLEGLDVELHRGWIPECFAGCEAQRFAFVHIDVDLHDPTFDSLSFFYPRMNAGGIIVCDDYGVDTCPGATRAMETFFAERLEAPVALGAGGCFVVIGCQTQPPVAELAGLEPAAPEV